VTEKDYIQHLNEGILLVKNRRQIHINQSKESMRKNSQRWEQPSTDAEERRALRRARRLCQEPDLAGKPPVGTEGTAEGSCIQDRSLNPSYYDPVSSFIVLHTCCAHSLPYLDVTGRSQMNTVRYCV
jgi:hypothetical protein